jgi:hypothetical protein
LVATVPVTDLLQKCLVVARKLNLTELRDWAAWELNGYPSGVTVPTYRLIRGRIEAKNPLRGWIPVHFASSQEEEFLSERPCGVTVPEMEALARAPEGQLYMPFPHDVQELINAQHPVRMDIALRFGSSALIGVLSSVRNAVLNWTLDLEERGIIGEGLTFTVEEKRAAASSAGSITNNFFGPISQSQLAMHARNPTQLVVASSNVRALGEFVSSVRNALPGLDLSTPIREELIAELNTLESQTKSPNPKGSIIKEAGASILRILEGAAGGVAAELVVQLLAAL